MDSKKVEITPSGLEDLKRELEERKTVTRDKIANDISIARDQGDLSENAAYSAALEAKQFNENRIEEVENLIKNAVVKEINKKDQKAGLGEQVKIVRSNDKKEFIYTLVGENESDPQSGKISIKSPIGKAILGKKVNDEISIELPSGNTSFKILKIN